MSEFNRYFTDPERIDDIIRRARVCRIAMIVNGNPRIIPVNFGYRDKTIFIHTAPDSGKMEHLKSNPSVCVEFDLDHGLETSERPCGWTMRFESVVGQGTARILTDPDEKRVGLAAIMEQYGGTAEGIPERAVENVAIIQFKLSDLRGKSNLT